MKEKSIIVGINWEQNSTACLMIDGRIVGAISEERFTRVKNDETYPKNAIDYLLKKNKVKRSQISNICFVSNFWTPAYSLINHYSNFTLKDYVKEQHEVWYKKIFLKKKVSILKTFKKKVNYKQFPGEKFWKNYYKKLVNLDDHVSNKKILKIGKEIRIKVAEKHLGVKSDRVKFIEHSFGHIAYAYCAGPNYMKKGYVASLDAFGDFVNYSLYLFNPKRGVVNFKKILSGNNLIIARIYRYITLLLGMKPNEHEYKVMGMAPYAKDKYIEPIFKKFKEMQDVRGKYFKNKKMPKDSYFSLKEIFEGHRFDSISGALQKYTEYLLKKWFNNVINPKVSKNLSIAGGIAMNVKANLEITNIKKIKTLFVPPSPDDSSQAIGACYAFRLSNKEKTYPLINSYLGYEIDDKKVFRYVKNLSKNKFNITNKNIINKAVSLLTQNKILGISRGCSEFGARALGNRSIVCNPGNLGNIKKINETIKNRDFWMPFAASILDSHKSKYFLMKKTNFHNYKYMTNCLNTKREFISKIIAAVHPYDGTCRPQIVKSADNKFYYNLIKSFGLKTGTYALMNTSFNIHGYPIINNESQALEIFKNSNLDALILGDFLISKY